MPTLTTGDCRYCPLPVEPEYDPESGEAHPPYAHWDCIHSQADGRFMLVTVNHPLSTRRRYGSLLRAVDEANHLALANTPWNGRRFRVIDLHTGAIATETVRMRGYLAGSGFTGPLMG